MVHHDDEVIDVPDVLVTDEIVSKYYIDLTNQFRYIQKIFLRSTSQPNICQIGYTMNISKIPKTIRYL